MKLQVNLKILLVKMKVIAWKESPVHTIKPTKIIATSLCIASYTLLLIIINRLCLVARSTNECRLGMMRDIRMVAVLSKF